MLGLVEANPLGLGGAGLIKAFAMIGSRHAEFNKCLVWRTSYDATGLTGRLGMLKGKKNARD